MRNQDKLRCAKLADALSHGKSKYFWQEVRRCMQWQEAGYPSLC